MRPAAEFIGNICQKYLQHFRFIAQGQDAGETGGGPFIRVSFHFTAVARSFAPVAKSDSDRQISSERASERGLNRAELDGGAAIAAEGKCGSGREEADAGYRKGLAAAAPAGQAIHRKQERLMRDGGELQIGFKGSVMRVGQVKSRGGGRSRRRSEGWFWIHPLFDAAPSSSSFSAHHSTRGQSDAVGRSVRRSRRRQCQKILIPLYFTPAASRRLRVQFRVQTKRPPDIIQCFGTIGISMCKNNATLLL